MINHFLEQAKFMRHSSGDFWKYYSYERRRYTVMQFDQVLDKLFVALDIAITRQTLENRKQEVS